MKKIIITILIVILLQLAPYFFPKNNYPVPLTNLKFNPKILSIINPPFTGSSILPFASSSATLGNSRLSYRAGVFGTQNSGDVTITIDTSSQPDNNNFHIFPKDTVCFTNA